MTYHNSLKQCLASIALVVLSPLTPAIAGSVSIEVGVKDANVCLGTLSDPAAFGAKKTDHSGNVVFRDVSEGRLQVTVSSEGYKSQSSKFNLIGASASVRASISEGIGGPTCVLASVNVPAGMVEKKEEQNSYSLQLDDFSLNNGAASTHDRQVKISLTVSGKPTHYRVSESSSFTGVQWQAYSDSPVYELSASKGKKTVYVQVKKSVSVGNGSIDRESSIASDNITLN